MPILLRHNPKQGVINEKMKRAVHFNFHTLPGIEGLGEKFNAAAFADTPQDSHVGHINFFARCNRGYSYHPTKVGIPYPSKNSQHLLPEIIDTSLADFGYYPCAKEDGYSMAAKNGNVIHIRSKIFRSYQADSYFVYKQMVDNAIRNLCGQKLMEAGIPSLAHGTLTKKDSTYLLHLLSYCPEKRGNTAVVEKTIVLSDVPVTLAIDHVNAVYSIPDKTPIAFAAKDGTVSFTVPKVNGHDMVSVETK